MRIGDIIMSMKHKFFNGAMAVALFGIVAVAQTRGGTMKITSSAFANGGIIPAEYSCDGEKVNPPLTFEGVPASATSLALIIDDPDVPKTLVPSGEFVHWLVWDIPPTTKGIPEADPT